MFLFRMLFVAMAMGSAMRAYAAEVLVDPKANAILTALSAQLASAKTAEVQLRLAVSATNGPNAIGDMAATYSLSIERPNRMALTLKEGSLGATVVSDGTNAVTFIPDPPMYMVQKAPKQIGSAEIGAQTADMGSMAFITAMFSDDPRAALLAGVVEAKHSGRAKIGDVDFERIDMKQEGLSWRLFATTEEKPLVRRIEVTVPQQLNLSMDFTTWRLNAVIPSERFQFTPPADAKKVDKFFDEEPKEGEDSDLVGNALPKLRLKTIDGENFDTTSLKSRVSLLLVWSGEAEHCFSAMKAATELAATKKGLSVYSINIDEKPDKARIKNLLSKNKVILKTAVDDSGLAVDKFEVEGVPTTFLIDKKGVIRKAYLGFHNDLKMMLTKEIDALLSEKN